MGRRTEDVPAGVALLAQADALPVQLFQPFYQGVVQVSERLPTCCKGRQTRHVLLLVILGEPQEELVRCETDIHGAQNALETALQDIDFFRIGHRHFSKLNVHKYQDRLLARNAENRNHTLSCESVTLTMIGINSKPIDSPIQARSLDGAQRNPGQPTSHSPRNKRICPLTEIKAPRPSADHNTAASVVLSQGQKKLVALARLLLSNATLWVLEEHFVGLDVHAVETLFASRAFRCSEQRCPPTTDEQTWIRSFGPAVHRAE